MFWISILAVPLQFWADPTFRSIRDTFGQVEAMDIDGGRVLVIFDVFKPLCFEITNEFNLILVRRLWFFFDMKGCMSFSNTSYFSMCNNIFHCEKLNGVTISSIVKHHVV